MSAEEAVHVDSVVSGVPSTESTFRTVNGVELHVVAAGDPDDPLVVLLHGYPEFWYGWAEYIEPLVDAGYRVLVPDQRGYNRSGKPEAVREYRPRELVDDVVGLVESEGRESAHVVGHDWGASVAWATAILEPETVDRLAVLNVPHPAVFEETLTSSLSQMRRSWYMFFYQLPRLPEWQVSRNGFEAYHEVMTDKAEPGTFTEADMERYERAWGQDGATTAMINWYRALFRHAEDRPRERVTPPTLVVWGESDGFLLTKMAAESLDYCEDARLERFPDASHWVNHERTEAVTELLLEHLDG